MIPKKIHYCWVGNSEKPASVLYCIETWKKYCPDYEIIEWNEENYDFRKNQYMQHAYEAKKWGFVPDYARLDIVYEHGGIYLDTDVELIKPLDELLSQDAFMGFEDPDPEEGVYYVNCGQGFGAIPQHNVIKKIRDFYELLSFEKEDGTLNLIASPYYTTQTLRQLGLVQNNEQQFLSGLTIYPSDWFCPKNYRTGKLDISEKTFSIHHFTASWMDEKIKDELKYKQKMIGRYGTVWADKMMSFKGLVKRYASFKMMLQIPEVAYIKVRDKIHAVIRDYRYDRGLKEARKALPGNAEGVVLDTFMESDNLGDQIIMENCEKQLYPFQKLDEFIHVPTHRFPTEEEKEILRKSSYKLLCGTNILSGHMRSYRSWKLNEDVAPYINTVLMGVGMSSYNRGYDAYTKELFDIILSKKYIHSVRDSYTEKLLHKMGVSNVINTGCPTMWSLSEQHCAKIPRKKSKNVICTLTDYCRDFKRDRKMIEILYKNYEKVYIWIQGDEDEDYINELQISSLVIKVPKSLKYYDEVLALGDLDYVGTRLHAGIRALAFGHRTLVVSIDNRAECIAADTHLPIIHREDVEFYLEERINSSFETKIKLPLENIKKWKKQFED